MEENQNNLVVFCGRARRIINSLISSARTKNYLKNKETIVARLQRQSDMEEARAIELQQILEAKKKLNDARIKTRQLIIDIDAVGTKNEVGK